MPIYEYACDKCKRKTEAIQRVGEKRLKICPHCGGRLKKLASAPAIQFKGSGWYVTDYGGGKKEGGSAASSEKEKAESSGKSDEKSGDKSGEKSGEKSSEKSGEKPTEKKKDKKASKD
jgi:putative FmdB family regulatory protein